MAGPHTKFYLDKDNKKVSGVCAGISDYWGIDVTLVRVLTLISPFIVGPFILLGYILMAWIAPARPRSMVVREQDPDEKKFWQGVRANPRRSARVVRARFREIDRRLADTEAYLTSPDKRLAREIESLR
jgi:phage shock protein C